MRVAAAYKAQVVVGADACEHRELLATEAGHLAVPTWWDAGLFG
jgi:hypothetical protein